MLGTGESKLKLLKLLKRLVFVEDEVVASLKVRPKAKVGGLPSRLEQLRQESSIGAQIFGPLPDNVARREFFNLDVDHWIWYEEFVMQGGGRQGYTTRYEVQDIGILKIKPDNQYSYIEGVELQNFINAAGEYYRRAISQLYGYKS